MIRIAVFWAPLGFPNLEKLSNLVAKFSGFVMKVAKGKLTHAVAGLTWCTWTQIFRSQLLLLQVLDKSVGTS